MEIEAADIVERFAIMTVDGGLSDLEALRYCLKQWPLTKSTTKAWLKAIEGIKDIADEALLLFERAQEAAMMIINL